jgi:arylsulfatase
VTTPEIDRWFADALDYRRAYATESSTAPSVVSLLSGLLPQEHGVRLFFQLVPDEVRLLPDLLPERYASAAFVSNVVLTDEALGIASRFDHYDDYVDERESARRVFERNAARTTDAALAWLDARDDPGRPVFLWVHYIDPHGPYRAPAPWTEHFASEEPRPIPLSRVPAYTRVEGLRDGNAYVARYDSEVAYVDSEVGRLMAGLDGRLRLDDALVILTADHGESMMEHERWFTHGYQVYDEIVRVPLLVRGPGLGRAEVDVPVSGVDVAATLLAFAGVEPPAGTADLRQPGALDPTRRIFSEATASRGRQWRSVVQGHRKVVMSILPEPANEAAQADENAVRIVTRRRFDLARDPQELSPQELDPDDPLARTLLERIHADPDPAGVPSRYRQGIQIGAPKVRPGIGEQDRERLRALGYVE